MQGLGRCYGSLRALGVTVERGYHFSPSVSKSFPIHLPKSPPGLPIGNAPHLRATKSTSCLRALLQMVMSKSLNQPSPASYLGTLTWRSTKLAVWRVPFNLISPCFLCGTRASLCTQVLSPSRYLDCCIFRGPPSYELRSVIIQTRIGLCGQALFNPFNSLC